MSATVLVVDDIHTNIKLIEAKLNAEYYTVLTADSGKKALEILSNSSVDIILLDVMMPEMDGFEVCKIIKNNPQTSHIPVVMVTALTEVQDRITGLEAGADDFLAKPINDVELFARIKSLVRTKIVLDELRLRNQTNNEFGSVNSHANINVDNSKILLIEDDIVQSKQAAQKLSNMGQNIQVSISADQAEIMSLSSAGDYDLLIISAQLTDIDSLRLCSQIRSTEITRHVPILMMVEEEEKKILIRAFELGVNDYIITPMEGNELMARSKTQIRRKRYQDALKNNYQQSFNLAITDALTGVYNRRYFDSHCKNLVDQAHSMNRPLTLMIVDIDHFKMVNDTYGHLAGDIVIKQIAKQLGQYMRVTDFVARYGGEEFVIVLPNTEAKDAESIANRVRVSVEETPFVISPELSINKTASIGVTSILPGDDKDTLVERADKALYQAKETGRNKVVLSG
jgi:two-component system cell cycle response regulator